MLSRWMAPRIGLVWGSTTLFAERGRQRTGGLASSAKADPATAESVVRAPAMSSSTESVGSQLPSLLMQPVVHASGTTCRLRCVIEQGVYIDMHRNRGQTPSPSSPQGVQTRFRRIEFGDVDLPRCCCCTGDPPRVSTLLCKGR